MSGHERARKLESWLDVAAESPCDDAWLKAVGGVASQLQDRVSEEELPSLLRGLDDYEGVTADATERFSELFPDVVTRFEKGARRDLWQQFLDHRAVEPGPMTATAFNEFVKGTTVGGTGVEAAVRETAEKRLNDFRNDVVRWFDDVPGQIDEPEVEL